MGMELERKVDRPLRRAMLIDMRLRRLVNIEQGTARSTLHRLAAGRLSIHLALSVAQRRPLRLG